MSTFAQSIGKKLTALVGGMCLALLATTLFSKSGGITAANKQQKKTSRLTETSREDGSKLLTYRTKSGSTAFTDSRESIPMVYREQAKEVTLPPVNYLNFPREHYAPLPKEKKLSQYSKKKDSKEQSPDIELGQAAGLYGEISKKLLQQGP